MWKQLPNISLACESWWNVEVFKTAIVLETTQLWRSGEDMSLFPDGVESGF